MPTLGGLIQLACQAEVLARKPGNVHPEASFVDLTASDFLRAAEIVGPILARSAELGVGRAAYEAVRATREKVATNANLGICLLIAPCAAAIEQGGELRSALKQVLDALTLDDSRWAYQAIRLATPGGLGQAAEQDVTDEPTVTLLKAMQLAADRDDVARQYATAYTDLFDISLPALTEFSSAGIEQAIIGSHLRLMAARPDTLINRKCGPQTARESANRAAQVLASGWPASGAQALAELDTWLRTDGHQRNPGTTADLVAATLFIALHRQLLDPKAVKHWCQQAAASLSVTTSSDIPAPPASRPH
jgi:triphosphoribosyl-dephospho-CoA synthase